jgi:hypothetical protein
VMRVSCSPDTPVFQQCTMALAGPPRSHENGAAAKAIFTPGWIILRTTSLSRAAPSTNALVIDTSFERCVEHACMMVWELK